MFWHLPQPLFLLATGLACLDSNAGGHDAGELENAGILLISVSPMPHSAGINLMVSVSVGLKTKVRRRQGVLGRSCMKHRAA